MLCPPLSRIILAVGLAVLALPASAQAERPPIALPGLAGPTPPRPVIMVVTEEQKERMVLAMAQVGCYVHNGNRERVIQLFEGTSEEAAATLNALVAEGRARMNAQRQTADLENCSPVPLAEDHAISLN